MTVDVTFYFDVFRGIIIYTTVYFKHLGYYFQIILIQFVLPYQANYSGLMVTYMLPDIKEEDTKTTTEDIINIQKVIDANPSCWLNL